jgi:Tfp pilus assembly protein PilP
MPNRNKSNIKNHKGKLTYVSSNYQRIWNIKDDKLEVQSNISVIEGESVTVPTEILMDPDDIKISKKKLKKVKHTKQAD